MKKRVLALSVATIGLMVACASEGPSKSPVAGKASDPGRAVLAANDGWAAAEGGVTGGAAAKPEHDVTVTSRKALVDALALAGNAPKIIRIKGTINLSTDDAGRELTAKDYAVAPYNFDEYMKVYAPAVWNKTLVKGRPVRNLTGPQEEARKASVTRQREQVTIQLPSNTTLIGLGKDAKLVRGNIWIGAGVENVIIRNIAFEDAFDYFPAWDPGDSFKIDKSYPGCQENYVDAKAGPQLCPGGRWNSEYDSISINGGKRVWIDHCSFSDGARSDKLFPPVFPFPHNEITQKVQHHDGAVDVTNAADLVTISYSVFRDHDKTNLIGGSDSSKIDGGKLRVTFHHNWFENVGQRMPRVRFGKVHVYNNVYIGDATGSDDSKLSPYQNHVASLAIKSKITGNIFRQGLGIGKESAVYSEANVFEIANGSVAQAAGNMGGSVFFDAGTLFNGKVVDLLAAINAAGKPLSAEVGWKPTLYAAKPLPATEVAAHVKAQAGPGKL